MILLRLSRRYRTIIELWTQLRSCTWWFCCENTEKDYRTLIVLIWIINYLRFGWYENERNTRLFSTTEVCPHCVNDVFLNWTKQLFFPFSLTAKQHVYRMYKIKFDLLDIDKIWTILIKFTSKFMWCLDFVSIFFSSINLGFEGF